TSAGALDTGTISFTGYDWAEIVLINARSSRNAINDSVFVAFNGDTTNTNYVGFENASYPFGSGFERSIHVVPGLTASANFQGQGQWRINAPAGSEYKIAAAAGSNPDPYNTTQGTGRNYSVIWQNTAAITRIELKPDNSPQTFQSGTRFMVVGWRKEAVGGGGGSGITVNTRQLIYQKTLTANGAFDTNDTPDIGSTTLTGYDKLEVEMLLQGTVANTFDVVHMYLNNDTTDANYQSIVNEFEGFFIQTAAPRIGYAAASTSTDGVNSPLWSPFLVSIPDCATTNRVKHIQTINQAIQLTATRISGVAGAVEWANTAAITRIQVRTDNHPTDAFVTGSQIRVYGIKNQTVGGWSEVSGTTTNATATTLASISVPAGDAVVVKAIVVGKKDDESAGAARELLIAARRATAGNVTQIGVAHGTLVEDSAGTPAIDADVDTGTQTVRIRVTGIASETWRWIARYEVARTSA
ncbi:MAG: hypothetical protein EBR82_30570, partial [Caulobacteraceae bacterium]|nr:hypothetical protein [Caulobacteraceae bacterium]